MTKKKLPVSGKANAPNTPAWKKPIPPKIHDSRTCSEKGCSICATEIKVRVVEPTDTARR